MTKFNKLVRDKMPDIIMKNGDTPHTRVIDSDTEFVKLLAKKLIEEAHEVQEAPSLEELADVLEVVQTLTHALGHSLADLENMRIEKSNDRGGFSKRIFLVETTK